MKIFHHANIHAPGLPPADAMVIDQDRIVAMGASDSILATYHKAESQINLNGWTLLPGLTDAHVHVQHLAESRAMVDCETVSRTACLERIRKASERLPAAAWVRGHGWNHNRWHEGFGNARQLDSVCGGHPAYLTAKSLHAAWANSRALALAGIDATTPDPPGGMIQRDEKGQPTGILFEAAAMTLVESVIPARSTGETLTQIRSLIPQLWQMGLVGAHDFDGMDCWLTLQSLREQEALPFRVRKNIPVDDLDTFIKNGFRTDQGDDWLRIGGVKLFADGALGPQTAAMLAPYENSDDTGALLLTEDEIFEIGAHAGDHGLALTVHAIGDRANQVVLNAFRRLRAYERQHDLPHYRHRIEHVQIIQPEDIQRMARLDIIASVQPVHATSDWEMADKYLGGRAEQAYAYHSMQTRGVQLVFGSDAPVEPVNPFLGIHAAVTRRTRVGKPGPDGWHPDERLTLTNAITGFSHAPAVISNRETYQGRLAPGYLADFILLEQDPFSIDPQELACLQPLATVIGGTCVYQKPDLPFRL